MWAVAVLVIVSAGAQEASAAVTLADPTPANAMSCGTGTASAVLLVFNTPYKLSAPAGAATGDLLVLTLRTYNESNFLGNAALPNAQSIGWIPLAGSGSTRTYYRIRLATDPAQYTVVSVTALVTASAEVEASIVAFSGADPATPFANVGAQTTGSGTGPIALPNAGIVRGGSARYSAITTDKSSTFDYAGEAPLTEACNRANAASSLSSSYELNAPPPTTAAHSIDVAGAAGPALVAQTYVIQPPLSLCGSGGATLTPPATIVFPSVALNGQDRLSTATMPLTVNDQTGIMAGWSISATSTTFTNGSATLPVGATKITGVSPLGLGGICSLPSLANLGYPLTLPAAAVAPTAIKLISAAVGTGAGPATVNVGTTLEVPANALVGTYSSTWTLTLGSGP